MKTKMGKEFTFGVISVLCAWLDMIFLSISLITGFGSTWEPTKYISVGLMIPIIIYTGYIVLLGMKKTNTCMKEKYKRK